MHSYFLPHDVFVTRCSDGLVFLDLRRNKYFGFGAANLSVLARDVLGWPLTEQEDRASAGEIRIEARAMAADLLDKGLLTTEAAKGRPPLPVSVQPALATALDCRIEVPIPIASLHGWRVLCAATTIALYLKVGSLLTAVEYLRRRRSGEGSSCEFDPVRDGALADLFRRARPLVFTSRRKCLFDSFVLAEFLANYRVRPDVLIGVATRPFRAHCWVQHGGTVLNDEVERVSAYAPILIV